MTEVKFEVFGQKDLAPREFLKSLLDQAISRVNTGASKTLTARLTSEKPTETQGTSLIREHEYQHCWNIQLHMRLMSSFQRSQWNFHCPPCFGTYFRIC